MTIEQRSRRFPGVSRKPMVSACCLKVPGSCLHWRTNWHMSCIIQRNQRSSSAIAMLSSAIIKAVTLRHTCLQRLSEPCCMAGAARRTMQPLFPRRSRTTRGVVPHGLTIVKCVHRPLFAELCRIWVNPMNSNQGLTRSPVRYNKKVAG